MKLKPIKANIYVKLTAAPSAVGKIILPDEAKKKPSSGKVISVGPDVEDVSAGDVIWFSDYSGHKIDEETIVITEEDVLAVEITKKSKEVQHHPV